MYQKILMQDVRLRVRRVIVKNVIRFFISDTDLAYTYAG